MSRSKPKYLQIYEDISWSIKHQEYSPNDLLPTEAELCQKYDTSRPTVSKAIRQLAKEKLVKRRAGFGTQVLAPGKSALTAGLLIPSLHDTEIFGPICASLTESAGMEAMRIIRPPELDIPTDPCKLAEQLTERFIEERVQGVFFTPLEHIPHQQKFNRGIIRKLDNAGIRVVLLDRDIYSWPHQTPYDLVGIDNIQAGYTVGSHLIANGCKTPAFVSAPNPAMTVRLRRIGARESLVHFGRDAREMLDITFHPDAPEKTARELLEKAVDGVICANDATAAPLLRSLIDLGANIPGAVRVCGFDDVKYASLLSVPLTSYHQPCRDIGRVAARVMVNRIKAPDTPAHRISLAGRLIVRESSTPPTEE
ncbi:MAG: GntR family transcriptional regulator [Puniceicoccales bacterium]